MLVFVWLFRILLIWWLATVVIRWISGSAGRGTLRGAGRNAARGVDDTRPNEPPDIPVHGPIEDADFEDMSEK